MALKLVSGHLHPFMQFCFCFFIFLWSQGGVGHMFELFST